MHKADFKALNTWLVIGRDKDETKGGGGRGNFKHKG